jgi:hypothetical protein
VSFDPWPPFTSISVTPPPRSLVGAGATGDRHRVQPLIANDAIDRELVITELGDSVDVDDRVREAVAPDDCPFREERPDTRAAPMIEEPGPDHELVSDREAKPSRAGVWTWRLGRAVNERVRLMARIPEERQRPFARRTGAAAGSQGDRENRRRRYGEREGDCSSHPYSLLAAVISRCG